MDTDSRTRTNIKEAAYFKQILSDINRRTFKIIGIGSGRAVFDLCNGTVAKVAQNRRGLAQNEEEYKISTRDNSDLFAKVLGVSEKYDVLIMEKAERIRSITLVWKYFNTRSRSELYRLKKLQDIAWKYNLDLVDFMRASSWGKVSGKPVIIDYGLTKEVQRKYYRIL